MKTNGVTALIVAGVPFMVAQVLTWDVVENKGGVMEKYVVMVRKTLYEFTKFQEKGAKLVEAKQPAWCKPLAWVVIQNPEIKLNGKFLQANCSAIEAIEA